MIHPVRTVLFGVMVVAQLAVPAWMIAGREWTLRNGAVYKFRTAPVDPYDAFRGRYVALAFDANRVPVEDVREWNPGDTVYAVVEEGPDGYARLSAASKTPPAAPNYIRAIAGYTTPIGPDSPDRQPSEIVLELPFDRFYMDEFRAPEAEQAYREHSTRSTQDCYAAVRVYKGQAAIEDLYIAGEPMSEFLRQQ